MCEGPGTDPDYVNMGPNDNGCSLLTTQQSCDDYGREEPYRKLCKWENDTCTSTPIGGWNACCKCEGGVDVQETAAPTTAPTMSPTTSPTTSPTFSPTTPTPTSQPLTTTILAMKGVLNIDIAALNDWTVPLYMYKLFGFNAEISNATLENHFFGPIPASIGEYPKFDSERGMFESFPNAIINVPLSEITTPSGLTFKTQSVEGLEGMYYLYLVYKGMDVPLYTQPLDVSEAKDVNPKANFMYFTNINSDGTPVAPLLIELPKDYSCMCPSGKKWNNDNIYKVTPPPSAFEGVDFSNYNYDCYFDNLLKQSSLQEVVSNEYMNNERKLDDVAFIVENINTLKNMCPEYYNKCENNQECKEILDSFPYSSSPIPNKAPALYGTGEPEENTLSQYYNDIESITKNNTELNNLIGCVNEKIQSRYLELSNNCEFMKIYQQNCNYSDINMVRSVVDYINNLAEDPDITFDEAIKIFLYIFEILFLFQTEYEYEPKCMLVNIGLDNSTNLSNLITFPPASTSDPFSLNNVKEVMFDTHPLEQIQSKCCQ